VTPHLRQYARLEREAVVIGVSNRVEIWDPTQGDSYLANVAGSPEALAEKLGELGIFG
jgi:MraZ protein